MMKLGEAANRLSRLGVLAPEGVDAHQVRPEGRRRWRRATLVGPVELLLESGNPVGIRG